MCSLRRRPSPSRPFGQGCTRRASTLAAWIFSNLAPGQAVIPIRDNPNEVIRMYGLTRATTTLLAAAVAGFLIWLASQFSNNHEGGYWAIMGVLAGAGLVMALSQLLG